MADSAGAAKQDLAVANRSYSPGIENLHPVASTSAQTLDASASTTNSSSSSSSSISLPRPPVSHDTSQNTAPIVTSSNIEPGIPPDSSTDGATTANATTPISNVTNGLNEEDAKLLASLSEGNGLFTHLSSLAQASNGQDGLWSSLNTPTKQVGTSDINLFAKTGSADEYNGAVDLNEALTRTDMDWDDDMEELEPEDGDDQDQGPIQAYAKLEFPGFSYYVQTLDVSIGRRPGQLQQHAPGMAPPQLPNAASGFSQAHITSESKAEGDVDVDLGPLKSISRLHARIFYYTGPIQPTSTAFPTATHTRSLSGVYQQNVTPFRITSPTALSRVNGGLQDSTNGDVHAAMSASDPEQGDGQFVLSVVGRNGAFVDDVWVERGGLVVLGKRTKIQIAERVFYFVLPPPPGVDLYDSDPDAESAQISGSESLSSLSSEEDEEVSAETGSSEGEQESLAEDDSDAQFSDGSNSNRQANARPRRPSAIANEPEEMDTPRRRLVLKPKSKVLSSAPTPTSISAGRADEGKGKANGKLLGRGKATTMDADPEDDDDSLGTPSAEEDIGGNALTPSSSSKTGNRRLVQAGKGARSSASTKGRKNKQAILGTDDDVKEVSPNHSSAKNAGVAGRKRKRGGSIIDDEPALKVGTPIGIEALQANKRAISASSKAGKSVSSSKRPSKEVANASTSDTANDDDVVMLDAKMASDASRTVDNKTIADGVSDSAANKSAKAKTPKSKKKKGSAEESSHMQAGQTAVAPSSSNGSTQVLPAFNAAGSKMATALSQTPTSSPVKTESAAHVVSSSASSTIQAPKAHVLPSPLSAMNAGSRNYLPTPSPVPTIPGPVITNAKYASGPSGEFKIEPVASVPPYGQAGATSSGGPAPPSASWPSTASIIASAASLANTQNRGTGNASPSAPNTYSPSMHRSPPGPEDKPDFSNVDLISQALRSDHCSKKGAKLTLQEVYEWIANRWVWFKRNGRHTGRDWQSSIRHAIGSSRDFTRIPRRTDEPGKGIFYTMSTSTLAQQHRENLAKQKDEAAKAAAIPSSASSVITAPLSASSSAAAKAAAMGMGLTGAVSAATSASPSSLPAIKIPLIIGTPPSAVSAAAAKENFKAAPGTIESLLETPPIVHHDGKLYLSPQVFGHLNAGQLAQIESLGAQKALQVLQAYLVTHLKERMRLQQLAQPKAQTSTASPTASTPLVGTEPKTSSPRSGEVTAASARPSAPPGSAPSLPSMTTLPRPILPAPIMTSASERSTVPSTMSVAAFSPRTAQSVSAESKSVPSPPTRPSQSPLPAKTEVMPTTPAKMSGGPPASVGLPTSLSAASSASPAPSMMLSNSAPKTGSVPQNAAVKATPSVSPTPASAPSEDPLSALSALAAHPEAAGLIALLRKQQEDGGGQVAKLTAGQLQLLQMANKLAAQQKKSKKKKKNKDGASTPGGPASGSPAPVGSPAPTSGTAQTTSLPASTSQPAASTVDGGNSAQS